MIVFGRTVSLRTSVYQIVGCEQEYYRNRRDYVFEKNAFLFHVWTCVSRIRMRYNSTASVLS